MANIFSRVMVRVAVMFDFFDAAPLPGQQLVGAFDAEIAHTVGVLRSARPPYRSAGASIVSKFESNAASQRSSALHLLDSLRRADGSRLVEGDQHVDLRVGAQHGQRVPRGHWRRWGVLTRRQ